MVFRVFEAAAPSNQALLQLWAVEEQYLLCLSCYTGCGSSWPCHNGFLDKPTETGSWPCGFGTERCCSPSLLLLPKSRGLAQRGLSGRRGTCGSWEEEKGASCPGARAAQSGAAASEALESSVGLCLLCNGLSLGLAGFELPRAALILGPCCALIPAGIHRSSGISPWHRHQGRLRLLGVCLAASHQGGGGF